MKQGTKLPVSRKKDTLRDEKNTWKHKCEQLEHELKKFEWISVDDRFPSDGEWVLIVADSEFGSKKMVTMAFYEETTYQQEETLRFWLCQNDTEKLDEWEGVTHWMPLPQPKDK